MQRFRRLVRREPARSRPPKSNLLPRKSPAATGTLQQARTDLPLFEPNTLGRGTTSKRQQSLHQPSLHNGIEDRQSQDYRASQHQLLGHRWEAQAIRRRQSPRLAQVQARRTRKSINRPYGRGQRVYSTLPGQLSQTNRARRVAPISISARKDPVQSSPYLQSLRYQYGTSNLSSYAQTLTFAQRRQLHIEWQNTVSHQMWSSRSVAEQEQIYALYARSNPKSQPICPNSRACVQAAASIDPRSNNLSWQKLVGEDSGLTILASLVTVTTFALDMAHRWKERQVADESDDLKA